MLSGRDVGCPRSDGRVGTCDLVEMRVVRHDSREWQAGRMVQVEGASSLGRSEGVTGDQIGGLAKKRSPVRGDQPAEAPNSIFGQ